MAEKNRTKNDYPKDSIQLVKAGLLFVAVKLGDLLDEIVVVGGSAAGLFTAAALARGGRAVRVLESKSDFEPDPRTLIVTDHFRNQLGASAGTSILNEIRRFELFTDGRSAQIALTKPDLIIERSKLIPGLAKEAQQAGAQVSFDSRFIRPDSLGRLVG